MTSYFEWMGAGHLRLDTRSGAMHGERTLARELYYGVDKENLYLRLDFEGTPQITKIELRTSERTIALLTDPSVEFAQGRVFEARVPLRILDIAGPLAFQIAVSQGSAPPEAIPPDGWIELTPDLLTA